MDVLVVEPLESDVLRWLAQRHAVEFSPALGTEPRALRRALAWARAAILPPSAALDARTLQRAPRLRIVGRLSAGVENIDLDACTRYGVELTRPVHASANAEAEFVITALLSMLRRVPVVNGEGLLVGRELGSCMVGIVGLTPTVRPLVKLLQAFGAGVIGYDPSLHLQDPMWARYGVTPVSVRELMNSSDAVCVLLDYFSRYQGLFGERLFSQSKRDQVLVSLAHSSLFDEAALARALTGGPLAAAWLDSVEPGALDAGRPLHHLETLQVTPRVSGTTDGSRLRSAWAVAQRIDEVLTLEPGAGAPASDFRTTMPAALAAAGASPASG